MTITNTKHMAQTFSRRYISDTSDPDLQVIRAFGNILQKHIDKQVTYYLVRTGATTIVVKNGQRLTQPNDNLATWVKLC